MNHDCASGEDGFTLIEILLSFAILVGGVAILQGGFGAGWRGVRAANAEIEALEIARARLAAAGIEIPLQSGTTGGDAGRGYTWRMRVEPQSSQSSAANSISGYWTTVEVNWSDGRSRDAQQISLKTLKLGHGPAGAQ